MIISVLILFFGGLCSSTFCWAVLRKMAMVASRTHRSQICSATFALNPCAKNRDPAANSRNRTQTQKQYQTNATCLKARALFARNRPFFHVGCFFACVMLLLRNTIFRIKRFSRYSYYYSCCDYLGLFV